MFLLRSSLTWIYLQTFRWGQLGPWCGGFEGIYYRERLHFFQAFMYSSKTVSLSASGTLSALYQ